MCVSVFVFVRVLQTHKSTGNERHHYGPYMLCTVVEFIQSDKYEYCSVYALKSAAIVQQAFYRLLRHVDVIVVVVCHSLHVE